MKVLEYTHLKTNEDVTCIAGHYTPLKEIRLPFDGREVLYVVGQAAIESSCCGVSCWGYVLVPGYVISWQTRTNEAGLPVSEVEPVSERVAQDKISQIINEIESIPHVEFW